MTEGNDPEDIIWDASLESGEPQLDAEHQELVEWLGLVANATRFGGATPGLHHATRYLRRFWTDHIELEERFMTVLLYDDEATRLHKEAHQEFFTQLDSLDRIIDHGPGEAETLKAINRLHRWLGDHIRHHDQTLIVFVRAQKAAG